MLISDIITTIFRIKKEQWFLKKLEQENEYDFIFSDGKYGFFSKKTPCYLLSHQLSFEIPKIFSFSQKITDYFNKKAFQKFTKLFIPDYEDPQANLAGKLAHCKRLEQIDHEYIGIISSFWMTQEETDAPIDFLFTISGYLHEHREKFIKKLLKEAESLPWRKVFILGDTKQKEYYHHDEKHQIEIYSFLAGKEKIRAFQSAKVIVSRAWYTTIMDLVELGKPAILFPTPNQTEQEYLAKYLSEKMYFVIGEGTESLSNLVDQLEACEAFIPHSKTKEALAAIYHTISS